MEEERPVGSENGCVCCLEGGEVGLLKSLEGNAGGGMRGGWLRR